VDHSSQVPELVATMRDILKMPMKKIPVWEMGRRTEMRMLIQTKMGMETKIQMATAMVRQALVVDKKSSLEICQKAFRKLVGWLWVLIYVIGPLYHDLHSVFRFLMLEVMHDLAL
jgi:hypothetical protein